MERFDYTNVNFKLELVLSDNGTLCFYLDHKEKIANLQAEIDELVSALEPFCNIEERASYSFGEVRQLDILRAESLIEKHRSK